MLSLLVLLRGVVLPRTVKPLSDTQARQAKPKAKEYNLADGKGLYLRVKPTGSKLWLFNFYKPITKKRANISLGAYPELGLLDARNMTQQLNGLLIAGVDPQESRQEQARSNAEAQLNTFQHIASKWMVLKQPDVSEGYHHDIRSRLNEYLFPKLGKTPIHKLSAVQVIEVLTPLAKAGKLETVKKICRWVNEVMVFSVNTGLLHANPLAGIGRAFNSPKTTNMPTLQPEQLPELMQTLNRANIKLVTRCLIEWQLHTMCRPSEASGARWAEINMEKKQWEIPAERMKKNKDHVVPLSTQAMNLLEVIRPLSSAREFIFPSDRNPRLGANPETANMALKRMGFKGRLVAHGLRALASTTLNEQGFDADIIEAALAHIDKNAIRAAYNRADYLKRRRVMMQWWSDHIEQAAIGNLSVTGRKQLRVVN
jgi:integrase